MSCKAPTTYRPPEQRSTRLQIPFGERDGRLYAPEAVLTGLACGCICPGCAAPLVARNRMTLERHVRPYFAHKQGYGCAGGAETALHKMAKQILADAREIELPAYERLGYTNPQHPNMSVVTARVPAERLAYSTVRTAVWLKEARIRSDAQIQCAHTGRELLVEVRVTSQVTELKRRRVQARDLSMIEIDLSALLDDPELSEDRVRQAVLDEVGNRTWVHYAGAGQLADLPQAAVPRSSGYRQRGTVIPASRFHAGSAVSVCSGELAISFEDRVTEALESLADRVAEVQGEPDLSGPTDEALPAVPVLAERLKWFVREYARLQKVYDTGKACTQCGWINSPLKSECHQCHHRDALCEESLSAERFEEALELRLNQRQARHWQSAPDAASRPVVQTLTHERKVISIA